MANTNRLRHLTVLLGHKPSLVFSSLLLRLLLLLQLRQPLCPQHVLLQLPLLPQTSDFPLPPPLLPGLSIPPVLFSLLFPALIFGRPVPLRSLSLLLRFCSILLALGLKPVHGELARGPWCHTSGVCLVSQTVG